MKKLFSYMMVCGAMMTAVLGFTSCEDDLDVQQAYPFTVETMPVPKRLVQGETAEIRCEIVREGYFSDTRYTIRYFQPDGEGTLRMDDGMVLLPNDRYPLGNRHCLNCKRIGLLNIEVILARCEAQYCGHHGTANHHIGK